MWGVVTPRSGGNQALPKGRHRRGCTKLVRCTGGRWPEIGGRDKAFGSQEPAGGRGGGKRTVPPLWSGVTVREVGVAPLPRECGRGTTPFVLPWYRRPQVSSEALPVRARRSLWRRGLLKTLARHSLRGHYGKDLSFKTMKKLGCGYTHTVSATLEHQMIS